MKEYDGNDPLIFPLSILFSIFISKIRVNLSHIYKVSKNFIFFQQCLSSEWGGEGSLLGQQHQEPGQK